MEGQHKKSFSYLGGEMAERLAYGGTKDVRKGGSSMGNKDSSINNIYQLDGRVPVAKAIPFGLQHILAMFVSNLAPITLIAASAQPALTQAQIAILLQNAMFVAGIATLVQLYPV